MPGACFAGQPTVSFKPAEIGRGCRSHRQSGTTVTALRVDLWKSSKGAVGVSSNPASAGSSFRGKPGLRSARSRRLTTDGPAGLATGDEQVPGHVGVETCIAARAGMRVGGFVTAWVRQQQLAAAPTASTRGCLHENAVAPDRSAVSLLHVAEQAPAKVVGVLSQLVRSGSQRQPEPRARVLGGSSSARVSGPALSELARCATRDALGRRCNRGLSGALGMNAIVQRGEVPCRD